MGIKNRREKREMGEENRRPTIFELLKPFIDEAREVQKSGRTTSEWVMKFATTYIGLIIAGVTYLIAHEIDIDCWEKAFFGSLVVLFAISISFAFICWRRLRVELEGVKVERPDYLGIEASDEDIKRARTKIVNNFERIKDVIKANRIVLNVSIYALFIGIIGSIAMVFYKLLF